MSPPLYIVFNADLVEDLEELGTTSIGWIDDVTMLSTGPTPTAVREKLEQAVKICERWSFRHASLFAPSKFQLVHFHLPFTRTTTSDNHSFNIEFQGTTVKTSNSIKILGVTIDSRLTFDEHRRDIQAKARKGLNVISVLNKSS